MSRELFNWETDDEELSRNAKVIRMPKPSNQLEDLLDGYKYTKNGMLEKEVELTIKHPTEEVEVPIEIDEKGREYFFNEDGYREYLDQFGSYQIRVTEDNIEEEFCIAKDGRILVFLDPEHMHVKTEDGRVLEYDPEGNNFTDIGHILNYYNPKR